MVLFTVVMMRTGLALTAGPLWYRSLLSCSVSRSGHICRASVVLFTVVMLCTGLALFAGPLWYCSLLSCSVSRSGPLCWAMMVPFIHYCHGLYRSGPICWATMVPFIHYCHGLYPGLTLSAGPLWYRSLLSWSVQVWPCLLGHYGTVHYCHGLYRSGPVCWATMVPFTIVMVCILVWPYQLGHCGTVHYCHGLYRSDPVCWATMLQFTIVMLCTGLALSAGPLWYCLFTIVMVCTGLALCAGLLYHSLFSCSVSMSGPLWNSSLLSWSVQVWPYLLSHYGNVHYCHGLYRSGPICWATMVMFTIVMVCTGLALSARLLWYHSLLSCSLSRSGLICWATTSSRAPLRSGRHRMRWYARSMNASCRSGWRWRPLCGKETRRWWLPTWPNCHRCDPLTDSTDGRTVHACVCLCACICVCVSVYICVSGERGMFFLCYFVHSVLHLLLLWISYLVHYRS